jgi:hypothetical protein
MAQRSRPTKRIRVRSKRLDQLDETKLALALWLMAKDKLADEAGGSQPDAANGQVIPPADGPSIGDVDEAEAA